MVKKELIEPYMQYKHISVYIDAKKEVEDFIEVMKIALERNDILILRDFETF